MILVNNIRVITDNRVSNLWLFASPVGRVFKGQGFDNRFIEISRAWIKIFSSDKSAICEIDMTRDSGESSNSGDNSVSTLLLWHLWKYEYDIKFITEFYDKY